LSFEVVVTPEFVLTMSCPDKAGIVAATTGCLAELDCFITKTAHFADSETARFFGRMVFRIDQQGLSPDDVRKAFQAVADRFEMDWQMRNKANNKRVLIMVSKPEHCLNDLLYRYRIGAMPMEVTAIVSNHLDLKPLADWHDIPYHHLPVSKDTKQDQEAALLKIIEDTNTDLIVLARYMQILTPEFITKLYPRVINIHHSFLPGFKGAKPYHQAHARGVKIIGATAHFVTEDLDEGPIITQAIERVDHTQTPEDLAAVGRDVESQVLARGVRAVLEDRVLLNGHRTIVFR
jgi:formyltetrahydrofolate deformylase